MTTVLDRLLHRVRASGDAGVALVTAIIFVSVAMGLAASAAVVATSNVQNSNRDRQAGGALQTAEAGVSQALDYIRSNGIGALTCPEPAFGSSPGGACLTNPAGWASSVTPEQVPVDGSAPPCTTGSGCFAVWIGTVTFFQPPTVKTAVFRIHSTGLYGGGPGARAVTLDVSVTPRQFPIGVFARTLTGNGSPGIHHESLFTLDCVFGRTPDTDTPGGGLSFTGIDAYYNIPAAAHSTQYVSTANNSNNGGGCNSGSRYNEHKSNVCNTTFPFDQDAQGGDLTGTTCYNAGPTKYPGTANYATTSQFTVGTLQSYGYQPGGLSADEYATLKSQAASTGTYYNASQINTSPYTALSALTAKNPVLYYDAGGGTVKLGPSDIPIRFFRATTDTTPCATDALIIIVRNGNLTFNSVGAAPGSLVASIFVPEGTYSGAGNLPVIGTLFANNISLQGTQDFYLDKCFVSSPPGGVLSLRTQNYREVDTHNVN